MFVCRPLVHGFAVSSKPVNSEVTYRRTLEIAYLVKSPEVRGCFIPSLGFVLGQSGVHLISLEHGKPLTKGSSVPIDEDNIPKPQTVHDAVEMHAIYTRRAKYASIIRAGILLAGCLQNSLKESVYRMVFMSSRSLVSSS